MDIQSIRCPICNNEMEKGFLQGQQRIGWVKKKHLISISPKKGEVLLENNIIKDLLLTAYICKDCKKIVVDYSDKEWEEG